MGNPVYVSELAVAVRLLKRTRAYSSHLSMSLLHYFFFRPLQKKRENKGEWILEFLNKSQNHRRFLRKMFRFQTPISTLNFVSSGSSLSLTQASQNKRFSWLYSFLSIKEIIEKHNFIYKLLPDNEGNYIKEIFLTSKGVINLYKKNSLITSVHKGNETNIRN